MSRKKNEELRDEEATELHWFMLEFFSRQLFGEKYEVQKPSDHKMKRSEVRVAPVQKS